MASSSKADKPIDRNLWEYRKPVLSRWIFRDKLFDALGGMPRRLFLPRLCVGAKLTLSSNNAKSTKQFYKYIAVNGRAKKKKDKRVSRHWFLPEPKKRKSGVRSWNGQQEKSVRMSSVGWRMLWGTIHFLVPERCVGRAAEIVWSNGGKIKC